MSSSYGRIVSLGVIISRFISSRNSSKKMSGLTFWVVRHAEREDNISDGWRKRSNLKTDNSPLSKRGQGQANEVAKRFEDVDIDHVIVSPFDRTLETATRIIGERNIPIKCEPGLVEALYLCEDPPGYESLDILKVKYPLIDTSYESVMPWKLPREGYGDDACTRRVKQTLDGLAEKYTGATIMLVSHGAPIGAIHDVLGGNWKYVGQATVSKFVEVKQGKYNKELSSDSSHLSDSSNLRPW